MHNKELQNNLIRALSLMSLFPSIFSHFDKLSVSPLGQHLLHCPPVVVIAGNDISDIRSVPSLGVTHQSLAQFMYPLVGRPMVAELALVIL